MARLVFGAKHIVTTTLAFCSYMIISQFLNGAILSLSPHGSNEYGRLFGHSLKGV
jgi:hypothetical protein